MDFSEHFRSMLERRAAGHLKRGQRNSLLATRAIQKRSDRREILKIKARRRAKEGAQLEEAGDHDGALERPGVLTSTRRHSFAKASLSHLHITSS